MPLLQSPPTMPFHVHLARDGGNKGPEHRCGVGGVNVWVPENTVMGGVIEFLRL